MCADPTLSLFALFASLLEYPTPALAGQVAACAESLSPTQPEAAITLAEFQNCLNEFSLGQMEELYTRTFDMQPVCYPYIGYHLFGESYKRGVFMAKLVEGYRAFGYASGQELPDHAAAALHFLSLSAEARSSEFGRALLLDGLLPALENMAKALDEQADNPYRALLSALLMFLADLKEREMVHA